MFVQEMMDQQGQFMELHLWGKGFRGGHVVGNRGELLFGVWIKCTLGGWVNLFVVGLVEHGVCHEWKGAG